MLITSNKRAMAPYTCVDMGNKSANLLTASEVKSDLRFEISDPNYLLINVHIAHMVWTLLAASEVTTASIQPQRSSLTSDFESVTPISYLSMYVLLIWYGPFRQPPRSLQHQRSSLTSYFKSVTSITHVALSI